MDSTSEPRLVVIGQTVSHYRIVEKIGEGGMGLVYKAEDLRLKRPVALKFLPDQASENPQALRRFEREALTSSALNDPHICTVHDVDRSAGKPFLVMEFLEGETLKDRLRRKPLSVSEALSLGAQIAQGLSAAHEKGIIHRDLKPSNVFIIGEGHVKILDFGLAKLADSTFGGGTPQPDATTASTPLTGPGGILGTFAYMSPEQVRGEALDARSDLFSLGVILYEMATGRRAFDGPTAGVILDEILNSSPAAPQALNPKVPEQLNAVISKCLEKSRNRRYQNSRDLAVDLERLEHHAMLEEPLPIERQAAVRKTFISRLSGRKLWGLAPIALLAVLVLTPWGRNVFEDWRQGLGFSQEMHVAVLPFSCIGERPDRQLICDGLVEVITSQLTQLEQFHGQLWVVPASEVREQEIASVRDARRAYGINYAVTGNAQLSAESTLLILNLVDADSVRQVGSISETYTSENLAQIQEVVVRRLAELLAFQPPAEIRSVLAAGATQAPRALDFYLQARAYLQRSENEENVDTAIELLDRALQEDRSYADAWASLGESYWLKWEFARERSWIDLAQAHVQEALRLSPKLSAGHRILGTVLLGTGRYTEAEKSLKRALELDPKDDDAYRTLGEAYERMGRMDLAESTYRMAIEMKPSYWGGYDRLGMFFFQHGRFEDAASAYQQVVALTPDNHRGYLALGAAMWLLEDETEAERLFRRSLEVKPNSGAYSNLATMLFFRRQFAQAAELFSHALSEDDRDYFLWGFLAAAYNRIPGKGGQARSAYEKAAEKAEELLEVNPKDAQVMSDLAVYLAELGERDRSLQLIDSALRQSPDEVNIRRNASLTYLALGDDDKAIEWIRRTLEAGYPLSKIEKSPAFDRLHQEPAYLQLKESFQ